MKAPPVIVLLLTSLLLLLPFVKRPVFVDDHAHFAEALTLPQHWADPYQPVEHMLSWRPHSGPGEANPPVYFYLMGAFTHLLGPQIWKAHLLIIAITIAGVLAFYALARPYTPYPAWAALVWLVSPHVWLTANSLLIDSLLAPFMLIGLALWIQGWRDKKIALSVMGAFFLGLAPLVKYTGLLGLILAVAWIVVEAEDKKSLRNVWLALPVAMFVGWAVWTQHLYGQSHFAAVAALKMNWPSGPHAITLIAFTTATTPVMLLAAILFLFRGPRSLRAPTCCVFILFIAFGFISGYKHGVGLQLSSWAGAFAIWLLSVTPEENNFWAEDAFLLGWAVTGLVEIAFAIRWVCGRFLVVASPAWVLLSIRTVERRAPQWLNSLRLRVGVLAVLTLYSAGLAIGDYQSACAEKTAALQAESWRAAHAPNAGGYYPDATLGGLSFYLPEKMWHPLPPGQRVPSGGVVLLPTRTLPPIFWPRMLKPTLVAQWAYRSADPFRTLDAVGGAGYYGSIWGPLPYSFSTRPLDVYLLLQQG